MLAILVAALLAAAPQNDTVFMADGGRVVGTVIEEAPRGVTIQLTDGTVRRYPSREVVRIEYADGSVTTPGKGAAPPAPQPAVPAPPPAAAPPPPPQYAPPPTQYSPPPQQYAPPAQPPQYSPPPRQYPPPAQPPQAYPPQPAPYAPRPYRGPPPYQPYPPQGGYVGSPHGMPPASVVYGVFGLGGLSLSGEVEKGISASQTYDPQVALYFEGGLRLDPAFALGLYLDIGVGEPASAVRTDPLYSAACASSGCTATTGRLGILLRHTFTPYARTAPWIAVGTGYEFGSVTADASTGTGSSHTLFSYSGWEALRLMAGVDLRTSQILGFGVYGAVSFGTYDHREVAGVPTDLGSQPYHTMGEVGFRLVLFP